MYVYIQSYYLVLIVGGHLDVIRLLIEHSADVDSQDNRKVSCLMAAFRRVRHHTKTAPLDYILVYEM